MKAIFIGDGGLFHNGVEYDIETACANVVIRNKSRKPCICIFDKNSKKWCPYDSLESVFRNWDIEKGGIE